MDYLVSPLALVLLVGSVAAWTVARVAKLSERARSRLALIGVIGVAAYVIIWLNPIFLTGPLVGSKWPWFTLVTVPVGLMACFMATASKLSGRVRGILAFEGVSLVVLGLLFLLPLFFVP